MLKPFYNIFIKSLLTIKKDPLILLPFMAFQIVLVIVNQLLSKDPIAASTHSFFTISMVDWLIPTLLLQPIVLLIALAAIQKKKLTIVDTINKHILTIQPFFMVSLLYKPLFLYGVYTIIKIMSGDNSNIKDLSTQDITISLLCIGISLALHFFTIMFKPMVVINKPKPILDTIKAAVAISLQYKWVIINFVLIYYFFVFFIQSMFVSLISVIFPGYLELLFLSIINGAEHGLFYVFILRLWLVIRVLSH